MTALPRARGETSRALFTALFVCLTLLLSTGDTFAQDAVSPEEELAARFAPLIVLQRQDEPCGEDGEPYLPAPVDVVFADDAVILREGEDQDPALSPVQNLDLFQRGADVATDLPGKPRTPGCDYETHFKAVMGDQRPVIYAHIATEEGTPGIALQYWFFKCCNHE
jgi:hypothetical protein